MRIFDGDCFAMPFHRNFTYWIDKRVWKYYFLMLSLQLAKWWETHNHYSSPRA